MKDTYFLNLTFPNRFLHPKGTHGTSSVMDGYFCLVGRVLKWEERWMFFRCGCLVGTRKGTNTLAGRWVYSQGPSKAQAPNAFGLMGWSLGPQEKSALLFWRCLPWLSEIWYIFTSNAFKDISSQLKASNGIQITYVFSLIARNNTWILLRHNLP